MVKVTVRNSKATRGVSEDSLKAGYYFGKVRGYEDALFAKTDDGQIVVFSDEDEPAYAVPESFLAYGDGKNGDELVFASPVDIDIIATVSR
jgi:hypothetical protein